MKKIVLIICLVLFASTAYAEVDLFATGNDWWSYSPNERRAFVDFAHKTFFEEKNVPKGWLPVVLTAFYASFYEQVDEDEKNKHWQKLLGMPCVEIMAGLVETKKKRAEDENKRY